eukprot:222292-Rhodomonas_salina.1
MVIRVGARAAALAAASGCVRASQSGWSHPCFCSSCSPRTAHSSSSSRQRCKAQGTPLADTVTCPNQPPAMREQLCAPARARGRGWGLGLGGAGSKGSLPCLSLPDHQ